MTITEVSRKYDITPDTLRYYERIGLIPPVGRTSSGFRDYQEEDCNWVEFIKCMRGAGISVEALTEYVMLFQKGLDTVPARKQLLIEQRQMLADKLEEIQATIERLDKKLDHYEEHMIAYEQEKLTGKAADSSRE
ncbi:MAG: MerR family transcriptional regulator [Eubacteriaceae bacterium]|jgi:DNA-binding transcriptional MerR regulator